MTDFGEKVPSTRHEFVFRKNLNPKFENGIKVIGTVDPGFSGLISVSPISGTKAWAYSATKLHLVDIEKGKIIKRFSSPVSYIKVHAIDENNLFAMDILDHDLYKIQIEDDNMVVEVFETIKYEELKEPDENKENVDNGLDDESDDNLSDDDEGDKKQNHAFSNAGYIFSCVLRKESEKNSQEIGYIQRYDYKGVLVNETVLQQEGKNLFDDNHCIEAMAINANGDICVVGSIYDDNTTDTAYFLKVITDEFDVKFSSHQEEATYDIATDLKCNILISNYGSIDVLDANGSFLTSFKTDFGVDGVGKMISVDPEGKAWISTEPGRVVVIEYSVPENKK